MASRNKKDGIVNLLKPDSMTKGISITVEEGGVIVEIHLIVEYGININTICKKYCEQSQIYYRKYSWN